MKPLGSMIRYPGGATRSNAARRVRFDLVPPTANLRRAQRWALGAMRHGDNNWRRGMPVVVISNHLERHWQFWRLGDRSDDHLAAVAWGIDALMECERLGWIDCTGKRPGQRRRDKRKRS